MLVTPDNIQIAGQFPHHCIGNQPDARDELFEYACKKWGDDYADTIGEIFDLFESIDGTYGIKSLVAFVLSAEYRDAFAGAHSCHTEVEQITVGFERSDGVLDFGMFTEKMIQTTRR